MAKQRVCDSLSPQIPHLDVVIDASCEQLVSGFGQANRSYRKVAVNEGYGVFRSCVPDLDVVRRGSSYQHESTHADVAVV